MALRSIRRRAGSWARGLTGDLHDHGRLWIPLGLTATGLAAAVTVLSVFLPVVLHEFTRSQTLIGFALGGEGLFATTLALYVGTVSDRVQTRWGKRRPFMAVGIVVGALGLAASPVMPSYWWTVVAVFAFFLGYYLVLTPYRALSADVLRREHYGRAQGYQQLLRGLGFLLGLGLGSVLFPIWRPLPFFAAALVLLGGGFSTVRWVDEPPSTGPTPRVASFPELLRAWRGHSTLHKALAADFLGEFTLAALRTFIVLYFVAGLDVGLRWALLAVGIVALANVPAAIGAGYLADRVGTRRVMMWSNLVYGLCLVVPFFDQSLSLIYTVLPLAALLGSSVITLSFPLVMELMPEEDRGGYSGLFELARGMGVVLGPVLTGAAIESYGRAFHGPYEGYPVMWLVMSVTSLLAAVVLRWMPGREERPAVAEMAAER